MSAERRETIEAMTGLMRTAFLPFYEVDQDALIPHTNGYSCWFLSYDQVHGAGIGTAPLTTDEIEARVERYLRERSTDRDLQSPESEAVAVSQETK